MKTTGIVFAFLILVPPALAQPQRVIGYVNGVFNLEEDAQASLNVLYWIYRIDFEEDLSREEFAAKYRKVLFYNETACPEDPDAGLGRKVSCLADLFESGVQNGTIQTVQEFWELEDALVRASPPIELAEETAQAALDVIVDLSENIAEQDTESISDDIEELTSSGHQVALVMHSQGNFFGNDAWELLGEQGQLLTTPISVATPDNWVAGSGEYTTVDCDFIDEVPFALPSNLTSIECPWLPGTGVVQCRLMCHSFLSYLSGSVSSGRSRALIVSNVYQSFEGTQPSESIIVNGSFTEGASGWGIVGDFWAGTDLSNYLSFPGYAAGGVDPNGYHKNNASGSLWQTINVPSDQGDTATLHVWINVTTEEIDGLMHDEFFLELYDATSYRRTPVHLDNRDATELRDYKRYVVRVDDFIGDTLRIRFHAESNGTNITVFRIDDVSLIVR